MSGKIIDPVIRSIHYIVALTIFVISLYLVKYEGLQHNVKNTCCESDAPWILKLERVSLNESKIVKKCSREYNTLVKVGFVVLPFFHFSSHFSLLFFVSCGYVRASSKILDLSSTSLDCCCIYPPRSDRAEVGDLLADRRETGNAFYLINLEDSLHSTCVNRRSSVPSLLSPDISDSFLWLS